ncbi:MAG: FAD:protein FMN transferase [Gammaproteobacteria bacterium]|nr:FAD:protein FMN transferase [Gammaproteobacteria bacterium]MDH3856535.1 FAD:protein FMN transferase [Gammaproteobacteria bacterium]
MSESLAGKANGLPRQTLASSIFTIILLCSQTTAHAEWHQQQRDIMGTRVSVELWHDEATTASRCSEKVFTEMRRIEARMSSYKSDSELSFINDNAAMNAVKISDEMMHLIKRSIHFSEVSKGAFDITYASVGYAYDYRKRQQPSNESISEKLPAIDYHHIMISGDEIQFGNDAVRINLGGIAKGYAVDRAADIIGQCGITEAMVSAGGDSRIIGDRKGRPWVMGIKHPRDPEGIAIRLPLSESAISTSGDYERFFIDDGKRVHHIINPATGRSATASWSATVVGPDALTTDALSTTIFILGAVDGITLIETLEGIDAIIIDSDGKVHYSSGFEVPEVKQ